MDAKELPAHPGLNEYEKLAEAFLNAYNTGDSDALRLVQEHYALPRPPTPAELRQRTAQRLRRLRGTDNQSEALTLPDAQAIIADSHCFENWLTFAKYIEDINDETSSVSQFEAAVDAVVSGDIATLERLLTEDRDLVRKRSAREHGATLLHYVAANGVEDFRQKTPKNAVEIAKILLNADAEVDADLAYALSPSLRRRYSERVGSTTLGLTATSIHPAHVGVQIALMETLLDAGAAIDGVRDGWGFVNSCLRNGRPEAAHFLAGRGALLDLEGGGGVGSLDVVQSFFEEDGSLNASATKEQMESGFVWACEFGHTRVVEFLLDKGLDIGALAHGMTGLHWAMVGGHLDTIKVLLRRGAPLEVENNFGGTVLGCAVWAVHYSDPVYRWPDPDTDWLAIVQMLIDAGATVYESDSDFPTGNEPVDQLLRRHGMKG
jgi:ankyrin repeat protein